MFFRFSPLPTALAIVIGFSLVPATLAEAPTAIVTGLKKPESVVVGPGGKIYVTEIGESDKDGDGRVVRIDDGKITPFAEGLNDPKGIAFYQKFFYVADKTDVMRVDESGKVELFLPAGAFPVTPTFLNDVVVDQESGTLYVTDSGDKKGSAGAVYRISQKKEVSILLDQKRFPDLNSPNGVCMDGASHILVGDMGSGSMLRVKLATGAVEVLYEKQGKIDGITWDHYGRLFFTAVKEHTLYAVAKPGAKPEMLTDALQSANDICLSPAGDAILVADMGSGTLYSVKITTPGAEVDQSPLPLTLEPAFPNLKWAGWESEDDDGKPNSFRPIVLTHNGDAKKVFVASQQGVIYSFDNDQNATESKVFADLRDRVVYNDKQNEEGFLGFVFHPKFKETGEVFVFYTTNKTKLTNIVSRFRVKKDNPNELDPNSEEQLIVYKKPFWNHDGGTIAFGPDGYLYVVHGDGGSGNDPYENAQNLGILLGKILRIDVDKKADGKNYAIPADNPFVGKKGALPEIYAFGFRNVWRMAFDSKSGVLWAADVGQNLWEEIDLIERGGNYGWNRREGRHPFGAKGAGLRDEFLEPIWEYHHDIGKSLTGGTVYRGTAIPELVGKYVYADYISNRIWALEYDAEKRRVTANRPIEDLGLPCLSFGQDANGEVYFLTHSAAGKGLYRFAKSPAK